MIYFIYGPDTYRSRQKLNEIIEQYQKAHNKSSLNLKVFDCQNFDFQDFKREIETISMFESKKLIILKNAFSSPQFEQAFLDYPQKILKNNKDNIIFFESGAVDKRKRLFKFLRENSRLQEFQPLKEKELENWVKKEFQYHNLKITPEALEELIIYCGNNLWRVSNEIKKIAANKLGEKRLPIRKEAVASLIHSESESDIFKTIEAISAKNKRAALRLLRSFLERGESPGYLLSMINYQFRNILLTKHLLEKGFQYHLIPLKTGIHPFAFRKTYALCGAFTFPEIKKIYQKIFQADLNIKTGRVEPETALDLLIAEI